MQTDPASEAAARLAPGITGLRMDQVAVEVVGALRGAGIRSIVLKGPVIAAWLYPNGAPRPYDDVDLLVEPACFDSAVAVLRQRGFRPGQPGSRGVSQSLHRRGNGPGEEETVDLHRSLIGIGASPEVLWREFSAHTEVMRIGGADLEVLSGPALALHVALHAAQHGGEPGVKPLEDLSRALERADQDRWRTAAALGARIDATAAFATGLRLDPRGAALAEKLSLPSARPVEVALRASQRPPLVLGLEQLATSGGLLSRLRFLANRLWPPPGELRSRSALARRGPVGLCLAYLWRPLWVLARAPSGLLAWRRARRAEGSQGQVGGPDQVDRNQLE